MHRQEKSGAEISEAITRIIYSHPSVRESGAQFHIPSASLQEPDDAGCNWNVSFAKAAPGYESVLHEAFAKARSRYVMKH